MKQRNSTITKIVALAVLGTGAGHVSAQQARTTLSAQNFPQVGVVDERFQSYNIEMLEVTGGKFWKPYSDIHIPTPAPGAGDKPSTPPGMNPAMFAYRPPLDLSNTRLRNLASALAPAYVRTSGTWANNTYFDDADNAISQPPAGFSGVLTRQRWKALVEFSNTVNAPIITSFATSPGVRDSNGVWQPDQARRFLNYTQSIGGHIAAAEFMNEPNIASIGGAPKGYDAKAYGQDFKAFQTFARDVAPHMLVLGPGSVGENDAEWGMGNTGIPMIGTEALLQAAGSGVDRFSYHHYSGVSQRCAPAGQTTENAALSEEWLARTDVTFAFYRHLRDRFEPGKPIWLTETGDAACGGNPWASTFRDTFRYLDQLGRLAMQGVEVVAHNTLVASDYGLLDENTFAPKPNYWGALLWHRFMGTVVLDAGVERREGLHAYAQCLRGTAGGVALLIINNDEQHSSRIYLQQRSNRYTLASTATLSGKEVALNGVPLKLTTDDELPALTGAPTEAGALEFKPATITFLTVPEANNPACAQGAHNP